MRSAAARAAARSRRGPGTAISARTALAETIRPDAGYLRFVREGDPLGAWAYWRSVLGGIPIGVRIRAMVKRGSVDPFDALLKGGAGEHEAQADPVADDAGGSP